MKFIIDIPDNLLNSSGIYKIINDKNGMLYIGRTNNFKRRAYQHKYNFNNGNCNGKIIAFIEQNEDAVFRFLPVLETDNIEKEEEKYIEKYNASENGFNVVKNDKELKEYLKNNKNKIKLTRHKPKKILQITEQEKLLLEKGYIRNLKTNKLEYNPNKAQSILIKNRIKITKFLKKKRTRNDVALDFSDLVRKCE